MNVTMKTAVVLAIGATASYGALNAGTAEAASMVNFSYNYNEADLNFDGLDLVISGSVEGDVMGNTVTNLSNLVATLTDFSGQATPSPVSLMFNTSALQNFTLDGSGLFLSFLGTGANSSITAALNNTGFGFAAEASYPDGFSELDAQFAPNAWQTNVTPVPTPALLPGLLALGGAIRRRTRQQEAA